MRLSLREEARALQMNFGELSVQGLCEDIHSARLFDLLFLVTSGANVDAQDSQGDTALKLAEVYGFPSVRKLLCRDDESGGSSGVPCLNQHQAIVDYLSALESHARDEL